MFHLTFSHIFSLSHTLTPLFYFSTVVFRSHIVYLFTFLLLLLLFLLITSSIHFFSRFFLLSKWIHFRFSFHHSTHILQFEVAIHTYTHITHTYSIVILLWLNLKNQERIRARWFDDRKNIHGHILIIGICADDRLYTSFLWLWKRLLQYVYTYCKPNVVSALIDCYAVNTFSSNSWATWSSNISQTFFGHTIHSGIKNKHM